MVERNDRENREKKEEAPDRCIGCGRDIERGEVRYWYAYCGYLCVACHDGNRYPVRHRNRDSFVTKGDDHVCD